MRRIFGLFITLILLITYCHSGLVLGENQPKQVKIRQATSAATAPENPVGYLWDNDPQTQWKTTADNAGEAKLELKLEKAVFGDYLDLTGVLASKQLISIDYYDSQRIWRPLIGCRNIPLANGRIDLSLNSVKTDALRLTLHASEKNQVLGGIGEVKVYGRPTTNLVRIAGQVTASGSNAQNPLEYLHDQNTLTTRKLQPESITVKFEPASLVKKVKLYLKKGAAFLDFAALIAGKPEPFGPKLNLQTISDGWQTVEVPELFTDQIQIKISDGTDLAGGIGEIEVWGEKSISEAQTWLLGANLTGIREFGLELDQTTNDDECNLWLDLATVPPDWQPQLNINGTSVTATWVTVNCNGATLGKVSFNGKVLRTGHNVIVADFGAVTVGNAILSVAPNSGCLKTKALLQPTGVLAGLTDGLKFSALPDSQAKTVELQLDSTASIDCFKFHSAQTIDLNHTNVWVWQNQTWEMVPGNQLQIDKDTINISQGTVPTDKMKLTLPQYVSVNEIMVFGSKVNQTAPRITLTQPAGATINVGSVVKLEGYVDNAEATVNINGAAVQLQGHFFSYPVCVNSAEQSFEVRLTAVDQQGRKGSLAKTFAINQAPAAALPMLTCELPEYFYTRDRKVKIQGTVTNARQVTINSESAATDAGTFSKEIKLVEGENPVLIEAKSPSGAVVKLARRIICDTQAPLLTISESYKLKNQYYLVGSFSDATPVEVTVNKQKAKMVANSFSHAVELTPGENRITVKVTDRVGHETAQVLTVNNAKTEAATQDTTTQANLKASALGSAINYDDLTDNYATPQIQNGNIKGPAQSFFNNSNETVSPADGSLTVNVSDLSLPGRDGFDLEIRRTYNSEKAQTDCIYETSVTKRTIPIDAFGIGWYINIPWIGEVTKTSGKKQKLIYLPTGQMIEVELANNQLEYHEGVHFKLEFSTQTTNYTLIMNDGTRYLFDTKGKLTSKTSWNGKNTIYYYYNEQNDRELNYIEDSLGRQVKFIYTTAGSKRVIEYIQWGNRQIHYQYNEFDLLSQVTQPENRTTEYDYEDLGSRKFGVATEYWRYLCHSESKDMRRCSCGNPNCSLRKKCLDSQPLKKGYGTNVIWVAKDYVGWRHWDGNPYQFFYLKVGSYLTDSSKLLGFSYKYYMRKKNALSRKTIRNYHLYLLNSVKYPTGAASNYTYYKDYNQNYDWDDLRRPVLYGQNKKISYRNIKFPVQEQIIGSKHIQYSYTMNKGDGSSIWKNSYILSANVVEGGKTLKYDFNYVYKANNTYRLSATVSSDKCIGPVLAKQEVLNNNVQVEQTEYQYEQPEKLNLLEPTQQQCYRGDTEVFRIANDYDSWGNLTTQTDSRTGLKKTVKYFDHATAKNLPETVTVTNQNPVTQESSQVITTYTYHPDYLKPETVTVATGTKNIQTRFTYYDNGNLWTKTNPNGLVEVLEYDQAYNAFPAKKTFQGLKDADGNSVPDIENQFGYNYYGRKQWEMDGRGYVTYYGYDDLNRLTDVYLPDEDDTPFAMPGQAPEGNPHREYKYNDAANSCEFWNENRQRTLWQFDGLGRLTAEIKYNDQSRYSAGEAQTIYHYNDLGQVDYVTDPNNQTTKYQYDGLGRVEKVSYPSETAEEVYAQLDYDDLTNTVTVRQENGNIIIHKKDWANRLVQATQQAVFNGKAETYVWGFAYDSLGNKVQQTNPLNKVTDYTYDPLGNLEKVQMPSDYLITPGTTDQEKIKNPGQFQPTTVCAYDEMGNKQYQIDANGNQTDYEYDGLGRLLLVKAQATQTNLATKSGETVNVTTKYYYDANGNKVKMTDPNNHVWQYTYSARGFLLSEADPAGNTTRYRYDPLGNKIAVIDPRNSNEAPQIWYSFSGNQLVLKDERSDKTFTTWYLYDEYNRLYRTVMPDKTPPAHPFEVTPEYDNPYTETGYDLVGNKETERDTTGQMTKYTYYPRNWVKTVTGPGKKESYGYDAVGNQEEVRIWTDSAGDRSYSITKQYDSLSRLRQVTYPDSKEEYTYDPFGNRIAVKDGNGNLTEYQYNNFGWQTEVTDPLKNKTTYRYDPNGNKVATITAKNLCLINRYDEQNRVAESIDSLGVSTLYCYDPKGNLSGKLDPRNTSWAYVYHDNDTLKQMNLIGADNTQYTVNYTYDQAGNRLTVSDTSKIKNIITYNDQIPDPLNRINAVERQFDGKSYRMEYEYNQAGQIKAVKYPEALEKINYQYNNSGQLSEVKGFTQPEGITYYDDGLIKNISVANNVTTQYTYNANRRLQDLHVTLDNQSLIKLSYAYDLVGNITAINDQVTKQQSAFKYYKNNWLKSETTKDLFELKAQGTPGYVREDNFAEKWFDFTPVGVISLDYAASSIGLDFGGPYLPAVKKIQLVPDKDHQTNRIVARGLNVYYSANTTYFTLVPKTDWTFAKGADGVITITLKNPLQARYLKIHSLYNETDKEGNPVNKATFLNDLAKMLRVYEEVDGTKTEEYQYDSGGNRKQRTVTLVNSQTNRSFYYPKSDRLLTDEKYGYVYDAAGNLIQKGNKFSVHNDKVEITAKTGNGVEYWEYVYDLMNRLIEVWKNQQLVAEYGYDPEGFRVVKTIPNGDITHYVFEGNEPVFEKQIKSGKIKSYLYALGKHLARVDGVIGATAAQVYYYHTDQVGSIRKITNSAGTVVWDAKYGAFGTQYNQKGSIEELHSFTGKELDPDTGLYYFNARWYDSELGRFISEDSVQDGVNWYTYGANNPLRYTDPTGNVYEDLIGNWRLEYSDYQWNSNAKSFGFWLNNDNFFSYGSKGYWFKDASKLKVAETFLGTFDFGRKNWVRAGGYYIPYNESRRVQTLQASLGYPVDVTGWYDQQTAIAVETLQQRYGVRNADSWVFGSNSLKAQDKSRSSFWESHLYHNAVRDNFADAKLGEFCGDLIINAAIFGGGKAALSRLLPKASVAASETKLNLQFFASRSPHVAQWELLGGRGQQISSGKAVSGGLQLGRRLTWQEQLTVHTERKILNELSTCVQKGDTIVIRGTLQPCNPGGRGCQYVMQAFAKEHEVNIVYFQQGSFTPWVFPK